jgi:nitrogen-specific signal transduction histidine kinase
MSEITLILAPVGRDADVAVSLLRNAGVVSQHFLATLSHELRTPLNAISGWTYLMRNARQDESLVAQGLDVLQRNTNTLIELISDLLDTSRIVAGTLTMEFREVDLKQVVRASVETMRVQAAEKGVAASTLVEIPETVPCTVLGDEARLHQILGNLLGNSLKFTPAGGSVTVQHRRPSAPRRRYARVRAGLDLSSTGLGKRSLPGATWGGRPAVDAYRCRSAGAWQFNRKRGERTFRPGCATSCNCDDTRALRPCWRAGEARRKMGCPNLRP